MGYLSLSGRPLRQVGGPCMTGGSVNSESTTSTRRKRAATSRQPKRAVARRADADPLLQLLAAMQDVAAGDFSVQLPLHWDGVEGKDRKSTRLNSSHVKSSYAVFCLKKKTETYTRA